MDQSILENTKLKARGLGKRRECKEDLESCKEQILKLEEQISTLEDEVKAADSRAAGVEKGFEIKMSDLCEEIQELEELLNHAEEEVGQKPNLISPLIHHTSLEP